MLYSQDFGVEPRESAKIQEGRYTVTAVLNKAFWPPWQWSGTIVSKPVVITILREGGTTIATSDLERKRLTESIRFYLDAQRFQEAYDLAVQVKEREPESVNSYLLLADALNGLRRDKEALEAYSYALYLSALQDRYEPPEYLLMRRYEVEQRLGLLQ